MKTRSKLIFVALFLLCSKTQIINAQNSIAIIDYDSIAQQIGEAKIISKHRALLVEEFTAIYSSCVDRVTSEFQLYSKRINGGCLSPKQLAIYKAIILYRQYKLLELDAKMDSLVLAFDQRTNNFINGEIIRTFKVYLKKENRQIGDIVDKKLLLYSDERIDYTERLLQMMNEREDSELANSEVLFAIAEEVESWPKRLAIESEDCFREVPENIDREVYKQKIETMTMFEGVKKEFKYLKK